MTRDSEARSVQFSSDVPQRENAACFREMFNTTSDINIKYIFFFDQHV